MHTQPPTVSGPPADDAVHAARRVARAMDRAWRASRTYGLDNTSTARFVAAFTQEAVSFVGNFGALGVVVEQDMLRFGPEPLLAPDEATNDSLPLRLYSEGVRELRIYEGVTEPDLRKLLDAARGPGDDDEDVVTRLWSADLSTIAFVTAEELLRQPGDTGLEPQEHGFFSPPPASFAPLLEQQRKVAAAGGAITQPPAPAGGLLGYEVSEAERAAIQREIEEEGRLDGSAYALEALVALLRVETLPDLLMRGLAVVPSVIEALGRRAAWDSLAHLLHAIATLPGRNPAFDVTLSHASRQLTLLLNVPSRLLQLAEGFAVEPAPPLAPLASALTALRPSTTPALCQLLALARTEEQRAVLRDALAVVGEENPEPVLKVLEDPRPAFAADVVAVVRAWRQPLIAGRITTLSAHTSVEVRREAVSALLELVPSGDGNHLVAFASDPDRSLRLLVLRHLSSGQFQAEWKRWVPHLDAAEFADLPPADQRAMFHAVRATTGDAAVPFWQGLVSDRGWRHRQQREHLALLAVDMLATLGTPAARRALEEARVGRAPAVLKAVDAALAALDARNRRGGAP